MAMKAQPRRVQCLPTLIRLQHWQVGQGRRQATVRRFLEVH